MISVIIPIYNRWDLTHARLYNLYQYVPEGKIEIIVVDDHSPEEVEIRGGMTWWQKTINRHPIRYYRNPQNLGFGGSCNNGAKLAHGDIFCFLSNDVVVSGDFTLYIEGCISMNDNVLIGGRVLDWDTGWNVFKFDDKPMLVPYAEGWLVACTRGVWQRLGGFDPIYAPYDVEDIDLSMNASLQGIKLVGLNLPILQHISGATIRGVNPEREKITIRNLGRFHDKWKAKLSDGVTA